MQTATRQQEARFIDDVHFTEHVNGTVVGRYLLTGRVHYDGRPQGPKLYGESDADLTRQANEYIANQREECGEVFRMIYPNAAWELRIFS